MGDIIKQYLQPLILAGSIVAFYFAGQAEVNSKITNLDKAVSAEIATVDKRVSVAETKVEQETRGYYVVQSELGRRLERVERKLDCIIDRSTC